MICANTPGSVIERRCTPQGEVALIRRGGALSDPRCAAATADVLDVARGAGGGATPYHAVLLDTDNGPDWLVLDRNRRLYEPESLRVFRSALAPGGVLGIWSAGPSDRLEAAMREVFGNVERLEVRPAPPAGDSAGESGSRTPPDFIYLSRR